MKQAKLQIMEHMSTKSNRVTMKMDVSHTDHSHIIGKVSFHMCTKWISGDRHIAYWILSIVCVINVSVPHYPLCVCVFGNEGRQHHTKGDGRNWMSHSLPRFKQKKSIGKK